jgi:hypothetical protein
MIPSKCDCHRDSVVGTFPRERADRYLSSDDDLHLKYDQDYLSYITRNHGGVPRRQWFMANFRLNTKIHQRLGQTFGASLMILDGRL